MFADLPLHLMKLARNYFIDYGFDLPNYKYIGNLENM